MSAPREKGKGEMGEEDKGYTVRGRSRGHRLPVLVVAMAILVSSIGAALDAGPAVANESTDATVEATSFTVGGNQTGEGYAVCPANKRVVGGGVVQSGPPYLINVKASGPLDSSGYTSQTVDGDIATQWYGAAWNGDTSKARDFKVFAICE